MVCAPLRISRLGFAWKVGEPLKNKIRSFFKIGLTCLFLAIVFAGLERHESSLQQDSYSALSSARQLSLLTSFDVVILELISEFSFFAQRYLSAVQRL